MKNIFLKLFFIPLIAITNIVPCYADNLLQQKAEKEYYENVLTTDKSKLINFMVIVLVKDDYNIYSSDANSLCVYAGFVKEKEQYCSVAGNDNKVKCEYAKLLEKKYLQIAKLNFATDEIQKFKQDFRKDNVIIDDKYFKSLGEFTKDVLLLLSAYK